jgi:cell division protease FtsH
VNNVGKKNAIVWAMVIILLFGVVQFFPAQSMHTPSTQIPLSKFLADVDSHQITSVTIKGQQITGDYADGHAYMTFAPEQTDIIARIADKGVTINAVPEEGSSIWMVLLIQGLPIILLMAFYFFMMRQMQSGGGGKAMGFGKSRARLLTEKTGRVTFEDVAGIDEAKAELEEVVDFLKDPQKFQRLGGKIPKGVLLIGPPGTGKTLLARAIAGEANVPFFTISGSDFVEMFVGVGASRVRDMFEQAKKHAPCIIFIDEIDAVGRHRGAGLGNGNDERTLNQLLVEMDGFEANEGVILIAATNRPDVLDSALLRPGRFDRQVVVPNPDITGREKILKVHMRKVPIGSDVEVRTIARGTPGFSGADLANLVNEAALLAARWGRRVVSMYEFEAAKDKVYMGAERRSLVMSDKERSLTAYHEVGHALVALFVPGHDPLHKVTIVPRGRALGITWHLPEADRLSQTKSEIEARLASMFGGRVAEEIVFGSENVTTGAASDIQQATSIARSMVTEYGMSERLGRVRYMSSEQDLMTGQSMADGRRISGDTARIIDEEVRRIIEQAEATARHVLNEHLDLLHSISKTILEYETLSGDEVRALVRGEPQQG